MSHFRHVWLALGAMLLSTLSALAGPASADLGFTPQVNGSILCTAVQPDGRILIGGSFTNIGADQYDRIARLNADGTPDPTFNPGVDGPVYALAVQADGRIVVGGDFQTIVGNPRSRLARLEADGQLDTTFQADTNDAVFGITAERDGNILVNGFFTTVAGSPRTRLARLDAGGNLSATFVPNINGAVFAVAVQSDERILIGGSFNDVNGTGRSRIARLETANGALDTTFDPGADSDVRCLAVQADGGILVGGLFSVIGGNEQPALARLSSSGVFDSSFAAGPNGAVSTIALQADGKLLIGGDFGFIFSTQRTGLARLEATGVLDLSFDAALNSIVASAALQADGKILLTGSFTTAGGQPRTFIARLLGDPAPQTLTVTASRIEWLRGGASPEATEVFFEQSDDGGLTWTLLGRGGRISSPSTGWESFGLSLPASGAIRANAHVVSGNLTGSTGLVQTVKTFPSVDVAFDPNVTGLNERVNAMAVQPDGLIVIGGAFDAVGGTPRNNLARVNPDGTLDASFNVNVNGEIFGIAVLDDGKILIAGGFSMVNGATSNGLALLGANGTPDAGFTLVTDFQVNALLVQPDGKVVIGGFFFNVGGTQRNRLARLNADGTLDPDFNPGVTGTAVYSLARQSDGSILVGGDFIEIGAFPLSNLARVSSTGAIDVGFVPAPNDTVHSLAVQPDGRIVLGGQFASLGGTLRNSLARLLPNGTVDPDFDPNVSSRVFSLALQTDGRIAFGGEIFGVGGISRSGFARLNADGTLDGGFNPMADITNVRGVTLQGDGQILAGGFFMDIDGTARNFSARLTNLVAKSDIVVKSPSRIEWRRGGTTPEAQSVTFELSTDAGSNYTPLGAGTRIAGGWEITGLNLPLVGTLRTRARTASGYGNASSSSVEAVTTYTIPATLAATAVTPISATLSATVDPIGLATTVRFEYGTDALLSSFTATNDVNFGAGIGPEPFAQMITGLAPSTTYYFRVVQVNVNGTFPGEILSFTTGATTPESVVDTGMDVPGEDPGTRFLEFGAPAIDGGLVGGAATVRKDGQKARTVIYGDTNGTVLASTGETDEAGSTFLALGDPVFAGEALGFTAIGKVAPVNAAPDWLLGTRLGFADFTRATTPRAGSKLAALYSQLSRASGIRRLARQGGDAPGVTNGIFSKIPSFGLPRRRAGLVFTGKLKTGGGVSKKNDFGVWRETATAGESAKLVGTGDILPGVGEVKKLELMIPVTNATDQRRSFAPDGGLAAAATFADGTRGVVRVAADGTVDVPVAAATAVPDELNARFEAFQAPATASGGLSAFLATLRAIAAGQPAPARNAIFSNRDGTLRQVARLGGSLPGNSQQRFSRLGQPLMGQSGMIGFIAALTGQGVTPKNRTVLMQDRAGMQSVVARLGDPAAEFPAGAKYQKFQSVVVTDTAQGHMVFTGIAAGTGVTKKNRQGLWAIGAAGPVKLLLRAEQPINVGGTPLTVRVFEALTAKPANKGQGRSTDEAGFVAVKATLSDGRKGVLRIPLP